MELLDGFTELFVGNKTAVGTNSGGCRRTDNSDGWWPTQLEKHLAGTDPCGVYPVVNDMVRWGCVDWDQGYEESWPDAINTHNILKAFGVASWIERSRSKGWHLWVFATDWVPAETMRNALIVACELVDAPIKEVNPKQTTLDDGQLGNYVRLPYPGGVGCAGDKQVVLANVPAGIVPMSARIFTSSALQERTPPAVLEQLAARYQPPPSAASLDVAAPQSIELPRRITTKLDPVAWLLMNDGPLPDKVTGRIDRSAGLYRLGRMMADSGAFTPDEAWRVMVRADTIWGKYLERGDDDLLKRTLERAWV